MAISVDITFDTGLYDVEAVKETARTFGRVANVTVATGTHDVTVTVKAPAEDVEAIAGALANIALARSIEVRS